MSGAGRERTVDADVIDGDRAVAPRAPDAAATADPTRGMAVVTDAAKAAPAAPGVYRMLGADGEVLYVGKAKALKRRVAQYAQFNRMPARLQRMVAETHSVEIV
ncbi:MAG: GIY-YIG nuclease family protein, partial [Pseudomonadota bacterium]